MPATNREAFAPEQVAQVAQHSAARERVLQVYRVDALPQLLVGLGRGARQVVHLTSADPHQFSLALDAQPMVTVDHRFALDRPALPTAPAKKIILQCELAALGVQVLQIDGRRDRRLGPEHAGCALKQDVLPVVDLVGGWLPRDSLQVGRQQSRRAVAQLRRQRRGPRDSGH